MACLQETSCIVAFLSQNFLLCGFLFRVRTSCFSFFSGNFLFCGIFSQNFLFLFSESLCGVFLVITSCVFMLCFFPQDHNFLQVLNLRPVSSYRLEVQVITSVGEGPATMKVFHTPSVSSAVHHSKLLTHWFSGF